MAICHSLPFLSSPFSFLLTWYSCVDWTRRTKEGLYVVLRQLFGQNANGFSASCSLCAHSQAWRLRRPKRKAYNLRSQQRHGARFTVGYIYNQNINVLIKYINIIPNFTVPDLLLRSPSDQDNLHPLFLLSSLLSHLY